MSRLRDCVVVSGVALAVAGSSYVLGQVQKAAVTAARLRRSR